MGLLVFGGEQLYLGYVEHNWQKIKGEEERGLAETLTTEFLSYQQETSGAADRVAKSPGMQAALCGSGDTASLRCFEILSPEKNLGISFDVYDSLRQLVAWTGAQRTVIDPSEFLNEASSYVAQGPIYSYMIATIPVVSSGPGHRVTGYVAAQRLFDVNYPISNRFINNQAFASTFTARLNVSARFDFSSDAKAMTNEQVFSVDLHGIDGKTIGFAYVNSPMLSTCQDDIRQQAQRVIFLLLFALAIVLAYGMLSIVKSVGSIGVKIVCWTLALWIVRYVMVWCDLPAGYISSGIGDPSYFASSFGFGIARSIVDLFITSLFLCWNVILIVSSVIERLKRSTMDRKNASAGRKILTIVVLILLPLVLCLFLRGFSAAVHSAVFDSTLRYNDPMSVFPSSMLSLMLMSLLLISGSLMMAGVLISLWTYRLASSLFLDRSRTLLPSLVVIGVFCFASYVFGIVHPSPLLGQIDRLVYVLGILGLSVVCLNSMGIRGSGKRMAVGIVMGSIIALIPQLDREAHLLDRNKVELVANDIVRPANSWLSFVLNRALDELSSAESANILEHGDPQDIQKLAFTGWAKSILSQQGYNCAVMFVDSRGDQVSDFHLGGHSHSAKEQHLDRVDSLRTVTVEEKPSAAGTVKSYIGYAPISGESGRLIGGVGVELSADRQALLRGETPEILRNYPKENPEAHRRTLLLSEYYQGRLTSTTGEDFPVGRQLPENLRELSGSDSGVWVEESVNGKSYESYFVQNASGSPEDSWISLSMQSLDFQWHLFSVTRLVIFYLLCCLVFGGATLGIQRIRGVRIPLDFRTKLLTAFVIVSFIPIAILAYYNRQYSIQRAEENTARRLSDQSGIVVNALQRQLGVDVPFDVSRLTNEQCENVANNLGADFNVYAAGLLQASSKPEMYSAELVNPRLSADAYYNIVLKKRSFFSEQQSIGMLPYLVGYRPLVSEAGEIIGLVAVPGLYRQLEIDEDILRRNAFLFGAYALAMLISLVAGSIFANQISSPLRRLQQATRQIASGDLSLNIQSHRTDEFGELERAFERMTSEMKRAQEEMLRAQRELAWKEMAKQVAHEIKNPLTPMKLSVQHLRQAYKDRVSDFESLFHRISETLLEQIEALNRIASEFSQFARMPARMLEPLDVHAVLRDTVSLFQQYHNVVFQWRLEAKDAIVSADREELRRAFMNLFQNAVQAMNKEGEVSTTTTSSGESLEITIADSGQGVPEDVRRRLFEPNFSTKTDGMGMGLAIVKKTIDELGGTIEIRSEVGKGTAVIIRLPLEKERVRRAG